MQRSKVIRDFDIWFMVQRGDISHREAKAMTLRRDMMDMKKEPLYLVVLLLGLIAIGTHFGFPFYLMVGIAFYLLLRDVYLTWMKLAEMETEIKYLEAGLLLKRS